MWIREPFYDLSKFAYTGDYKLPASIIDRSDPYSRPIFEAEIEQTEDIPQEVLSILFRLQLPGTFLLTISSTSSPHTSALHPTRGSNTQKQNDALD
jgi:hypothetical protein